MSRPAVALLACLALVLLITACTAQGLGPYWAVSPAPLASALPTPSPAAWPRPLVLQVRIHDPRTGSDGPPVQTVEVDAATVADWLGVSRAGEPASGPPAGARPNHDLIAAYLRQLAAGLDRPVVEGAVDFDPQTGQLTVLTESYAGQELSVAGGVLAIHAALLAGWPEANLSVIVKPPHVDTSDPAQMGIRELISQGTTTFAGSPPERVTNIAAAARRFRNAVVGPGEEFSFDRVLGEISPANGYVNALVISGDRTEMGLGGGVCQVSTTVFRAAYAGGFPIIERWAHAYIVHWYGEPGLDATVYSPTVDLRFRNDTSHYLLLQPAIDTKASKLTFYIYGTNPGRKVESVGPIISNVQPAPAPAYVEDKSLKAGTIRQVDWAVNGADAVMIRRVRNADGTVREETFTSHYRPWRAVYLYGPGTALPK
jgi:vancomycin resistance protein YoaR